MNNPRWTGLVLFGLALLTISLLFLSNPVDQIQGQEVELVECTEASVCEFTDIGIVELAHVITPLTNGPCPQIAEMTRQYVTNLLYQAYTIHVQVAGGDRALIWLDREQELGQLLLAKGLAESSRQRHSNCFRSY